MLSLCEIACKMAFTQKNATIEETVATVLSYLESSPLTNAGLGSCLTEEGKVECDASIMFGNGTFGSVGAVSGVEHPIQVAYKLAKDHDENGLIKDMGRVRPIMLVGNGAYEYASKHGLAVCPRDQMDEYLITPRTKAVWKLYKTVIEQHHASLSKKGMDIIRSSESNSHHLLPNSLQRNALTDRLPEDQGTSPSSTPDTIGVIGCDEKGDVCAATSSGGVWMKHPGRIGSSSVIGAGCYAENANTAEENQLRHSRKLYSIASTTSGCGEDIIEQLTSLQCCELLQKSEPNCLPMRKVMQQLISKRHISSQSTSSTRGKKRFKNNIGGMDTRAEDGGLSTGIIAMVVDVINRRSEHQSEENEESLLIDFCFGHTAQHFGVAYATKDDSSDEGQRAMSWISTLDENEMENRDFKTKQVQLQIRVSSQKK